MPKQAPSIHEHLSVFESDLRAGRIRKRGRRKPSRGDHPNTTMGRIRAITSGCGLERIDQLTVDKVNAFLDRSQANGTIKTAQTRRPDSRRLSGSKTCRSHRPAAGHALWFCGEHWLPWQRM